MLTPDLLELLACPECKGKLALKPAGDGLKCEPCRRVYPIRDGIPVLLTEESVVEEM